MQRSPLWRGREYVRPRRLAPESEPVGFDRVARWRSRGPRMEMGGSAGSNSGMRQPFTPFTKSHPSPGCSGEMAREHRPPAAASAGGEGICRAHQVRPSELETRRRPWTSGDPEGTLLELGGRWYTPRCPNFGPPKYTQVHQADCRGDEVPEIRLGVRHSVILAVGRHAAHLYEPAGCPSGINPGGAARPGNR